jgi:hypothetical protein
MTITLNADYDVTLSTAMLGYVGETNARPVSVEGLTVDGADRYVLTIDYGDGVTYEVDITGGQWTPTADILRSAQTVSCQIAAKKLSGQEYILVKKSRIFRLRIGAAIGDNAVPSPDVAMDALDRIDAIGRQTHADMQTAVTAAETATTAAENAKKSATNAEKSADTATQASVSAQQTTADKTITAGYAKTAKTNADSTAADRQAVADMAEQVEADKTTVADNATKVAEDRTAAETAAQTAQAVADSLPEDYTTAVGKIAENTADIASIKLNDKEMKRRVDALYDIGQGITHKFETDSDTAYAKTVPTGAKLMSVKSVGGRSIVWNQLVKPVPAVVTGAGVKATFSDDGIITLNGTATTTGSAVSVQPVKNQKGHKYLMIANPLSGVYGKDQLQFSSQSYGQDSTGHGTIITNESSNEKWYYTLYVYEGVTYDNVKLQPQIFDLTAMFGSGNEPSTVEEFEKMFPADYYPYNAGEIISADTESIIEQGANLYYGTDMLKCGSDDYEYIANSYRCKAIKLKPNTTYTLSFTSDKTSEIILLMNVNTVVNSQPYLDFRKTSDNRSYRTGDNGCLYVGVYAGNDNVVSADVVKRLSECKIMISEGDTPTAYAPFHRNEYAIPEAIKALPGYGIEGNTVDYEAETYTQNNTVDGTEIKALDTPIVTDISTMLADDFLRNIEVEAGGSVTFKNSNGDSYRIPVPSEEEYIVKLSEVGGTT